MECLLVDDVDLDFSSSIEDTNFSLKDIKKSTINQTKMAQKINRACYLHRIDVPRGFGCSLGVKWMFVDGVIGNGGAQTTKFSRLKKDCAVASQAEGIWPIPSVL